MDAVFKAPESVQMHSKLLQSQETTKKLDQDSH